MSCVSQVFSTLTGAIFEGENNEMTHSGMKHINLFKDLNKEQVGREFKGEKNFIRSKRENWWENVTEILKHGNYIQS